MLKSKNKMDSKVRSQKVFIQFVYCPLCRLNHKKGKKHAFTERHQQIVGNILKKYSKKIEEAKKSVDEPNVKESQWSDTGRQFWCYFCQSDADLHKTNFTDEGSCVVEFGGILQHIVGDDHLTKTKTFLRENRVDLSRTTDFVLSSHSFVRFLENTEKAISSYFEKQKQKICQVSSLIKAQASLRQQVVVAGLMEQTLRMQQKTNTGVISTFNDSFVPDDDLGERRKTVRAFGEGLTAIDRSKEDDSLGNIYTNATPPWLLPAEDKEDKATEIGPTIKDLEKHRKLVKKAKLPACRVGAKFDRQGEQSESWMPSFGGVWHHSRRTDSVKQFNRRHNVKKPHDTAVPYSSMPTLSPVPDSTNFGSCSGSKLQACRTATAPSPWNSYINRGGTTDPNTVAQLYDNIPTIPDFHSIRDFSNDHVQNIKSTVELSASDSHLASIDSSLCPEGTSTLTVRPYVRKRKRSAVSSPKELIGKLACYSPQSIVNNVVQHRELPGFYSRCGSSSRHNVPQSFEFHNSTHVNGYNSTNCLGHRQVSSSATSFNVPRTIGNVGRSDSYNSDDSVKSNRAFTSANTPQYGLITTPLLQDQKKK